MNESFWKISSLLLRNVGRAAKFIFWNTFIRYLRLYIYIYPNLSWYSYSLHFDRLMFLFGSLKFCGLEWKNSFLKYFLSLQLNCPVFFLYVTYQITHLKIKAWRTWQFSHKTCIIFNLIIASKTQVFQRAQLFSWLTYIIYKRVTSKKLNYFGELKYDWLIKKNIRTVKILLDKFYRSGLFLIHCYGATFFWKFFYGWIFFWFTLTFPCFCFVP